MFIRWFASNYCSKYRIFTIYLHSYISLRMMMYHESTVHNEPNSAFVDYTTFRVRNATINQSVFWDHTTVVVFRDDDLWSVVVTIVTVLIDMIQI